MATTPPGDPPAPEPEMNPWQAWQDAGIDPGDQQAMESLEWGRSLLYGTEEEKAHAAQWLAENRPDALQAFAEAAQPPPMAPQNPFQAAPAPPAYPNQFGYQPPQPEYQPQGYDPYGNPVYAPAAQSAYPPAGQSAYPPAGQNPYPQPGQQMAPTPELIEQYFRQVADERARAAADKLKNEWTMQRNWDVIRSGMAGIPAEHQDLVESLVESQLRSWGSRGVSEQQLRDLPRQQWERVRVAAMADQAAAMTQQATGSPGAPPPTGLPPAGDDGQSRGLSGAAERARELMEQARAQGM